MRVTGRSASPSESSGAEGGSISWAPLDTTEIRSAVDSVLADFLAVKLRSADSLPLPGVLETVRDFVLDGGKRIRPVLCVLGWHAAGGHGDLGPVLKAAASLELFHAFTLIHDDVMDGSATRRGRQSVHRALAESRRQRGGSDDAERFGANAAVLLGDLALVWSDELLHTAGLSPESLRAALAVLDTMRTEVMLGQYLDLLATGRPRGDVSHAVAIARFKTAKYTIERPLHLGVALAGAGRATREACSDYAIPIGEAFQFRDDILGVFGDPERTGKPVLDDLREGKPTVLMALATTRATPAQLRVLRAAVGYPGLDERSARAVRAVLEATGAHEDVERMINERHSMALAVLDRALFPPAVTATLRHLAHGLCARVS
jgi:geranylgeranyl diphosphate synthase, type I